MDFRIRNSLLTAGLMVCFVGTAAVADDPAAALFDEFASPIREIDAPVDSGDRATDLNLEIRQLQQQLNSLTGMYDDLYDRVESERGQPVDIELASLKRRLDSPDGCFSESCSPHSYSNCCNSVSSSCCEPCCERCGFYAGFAVVWIRPHFQENTSYIVDPPPDDNVVVPFDYDYEITPRIWMGFQSASGLGMRSRYWEFDHDTGPMSQTATATTAPIFVEVYGARSNIARNAFAADTETMTTTHSLRLNAFDLEATKAFHPGTSSMLLGFGLRYAKMKQKFRAEVTTAADVIDELVVHDHGFEGFGPTVSLEVIHPFGDGGFDLYGALRASVLFGDAYQDILEIKNAGADVGRDSYRGEETLSIAEIAMGVQYSYETSGGTLYFVRGGYEGQIWFDAGGPIGTTGDMALEGLSLAFGFDR